jgi:hypothetical protein
MAQIKTPADLQNELQALLRYASSSQPSRVKIAKRLKKLAAGVDIKKIYKDSAKDIAKQIEAELGKLRQGARATIDLYSDAYHVEGKVTVMDEDSVLEMVEDMGK